MSQNIEDNFLRVKLLLVRIMAKFGGTKETFGILVNVICVDMGGGYRSVFTLRQFIDLYPYNRCFFMDVLLQLKN